MRRGKYNYYIVRKNFMDCTFEPMSPEHERDVMDIFNYYAEQTFYAYPEGKLPNMFYSRFLEIAKMYPAFVIKHDHTIIGFCLLRPYNPFPVFKETAEISYFIKKEYTGNGIGKKALDKLEESAKKMGIKTILADISSENHDSINFHQKNGFKQCGAFTKIGKKFNQYFDVIWMEKEL